MFSIYSEWLLDLSNKAFFEGFIYRAEFPVVRFCSAAKRLSVDCFCPIIIFFDSDFYWDALTRGC
jgi:hypothetical protein